MKASEMPYPKPMGARAAVKVAERELAGNTTRRAGRAPTIIPSENRLTVPRPAGGCRTCERFTRRGGACPGLTGEGDTNPVCRVLPEDAP